MLPLRSHLLLVPLFSRSSRCFFHNYKHFSVQVFDFVVVLIHAFTKSIDSIENQTSSARVRSLDSIEMRGERVKKSWSNFLIIIFLLNFDTRFLSITRAQSSRNNAIFNASLTRELVIVVFVLFSTFRGRQRTANEICIVVVFVFPIDRNIICFVYSLKREFFSLVSKKKRF